MRIKCEIETGIVYVLVVRAVKTTESSELSKCIHGFERVYLTKTTALREWHKLIGPVLEKSQPEEYWKKKSFEAVLYNLFHSNQFTWHYDGELFSFLVTLSARPVNEEVVSDI